MTPTPACQTVPRMSVRNIRASGYDINDLSMMPKFYKGLPFKLREAIVSHKVGPFTVEEWIEATHKHQQKYLFLKAERGLANLKNRPRQTGQPTQAQWRNAFSKPNKPRDPNAMDQTPRRIRARQITTDEKEELMRMGRCFNCKEQGHLS